MLMIYGFWLTWLHWNARGETEKKLPTKLQLDLLVVGFGWVGIYLKGKVIFWRWTEVDDTSLARFTLSNEMQVKIGWFCVESHATNWICAKKCVQWTCMLSSLQPLKYIFRTMVATSFWRQTDLSQQPHSFHAHCNSFGLRNKVIHFESVNSLNSQLCNFSLLKTLSRQTSVVIACPQVQSKIRASDTFVLYILLFQSA